MDIELTEEEEEGFLVLFPGIGLGDEGSMRGRGEGDCLKGRGEGDCLVRLEGEFLGRGEADCF